MMLAMSAAAPMGAPSVAQAAVLQNTTMPMRMSNLGFGNVLPQWKWMCKRNGGEFNAGGYCRVNMPKGSNFVENRPRSPNHRGACDVAIDPICPDYTYEGVFQDQRTMTLPYTVQDTYDRAQAPANAPVLTLSNDRIRATITPQWGGRVWGLDALTASGEYEMVYKNKYFQPNNDALRQAYTQGGIEWNFGTQIGHMSQTQDPMWAARMPTERGDVLRVWTFERISRTVWQVDNFVQGDVLYCHAKISPVVDDINAYWWTNAGVHNDVDGSQRMRILTPATGFVSDAGLAAIAPWPYLYERADLGTGARDKVSHDGEYLYPNYPSLQAAARDHSFPFMWWEKRDVWYTATPERKMRYNGWADGHGRSFIHAHPGNGTKAWLWGTSPNEQYWQRFGSANRHETPLQPFTYTELQAGVMPTQYQSWPMAKGSTKQWTEAFTRVDGVPTDTLMDADYHGKAIPAVDGWMDSAGIGSRNSSVYDDVDAFLAALADTPPLEANLLHRGEAYGGLEAQRMGVDTLTKGTIWPTKELDREEQPWAELLSEAGTFSAQTLSRHPTSFMTSKEWLALLNASAAKHGSTWLHEYHMGVAIMDTVNEPSDAPFTAAAAHFAASLAKKESAEALRSLAIVDSAGGSFAAAHDKYLRALKLATDPADSDAPGAALFARNLAGEIAQFLSLTGMDDELVAFINSDAATAEGKAQDRYRAAEAHAAFHQKKWSTVYRLLDCAPERQWPTFGYELVPLLALYQQTAVAEAEEKKGGALEWRERNAALRANPPPLCLTAVGH